MGLRTLRNIFRDISAMRYFGLLLPLALAAPDGGLRSAVFDTQKSTAGLDTGNYGCWCRFPRWDITDPADYRIPNGSGQPVAMYTVLQEQPSEIIFTTVLPSVLGQLMIKSLPVVRLRMPMSACRKCVL